MKKRIKKKKKHIFKIILVFLIFIISFIYSFNYIKNSKLNISSEVFLKKIISESNHNIKKENNTILNSIIKTITNIDFNKPSTIFKSSYNDIVDTASEGSKTTKVSKYVNDPYKEKEIEEPIVYIYNTHQLEEYSTKNIEIYNIVPNVMMTSYILREKLNNLGIKSIVEENNVQKVLDKNNWKYANSYKVTRSFMEEKYKNNNKLNYFIDIHRDSVSKNITTAIINNESYAKLLFILGLENPKYKENEVMIKKINDKLIEKYPGISRGIYEKKGKGVNGVYNQDFNSNVILVEVGGYENTIDEVLLSTNALANVLSEYIKEDKHE